MWRLSLLGFPILGPMLLWPLLYVRWPPFSIPCFPRDFAICSNDVGLGHHHRLCHRGGNPSFSSFRLRRTASSSFLHFLPKSRCASASTLRRKRHRRLARPKFGTKMRRRWKSAGIQPRRCGTSHASLTNSIARSACHILGKCGDVHACTTSSNPCIGIRMEHHCATVCWVLDL